MSSAPADPVLSAAGVARAEKLAAMLADANIKGIYVTEFKRTQGTAAPLAARVHVPVAKIDSKDTARLIATMKQQHPHDVVLVVAHSNTMPDIIKALGGPSIAIGDNEYDNIFVLVPGTGVMSRIRF
jgi:broad specificity phosphatase PhoE